MVESERNPKKWWKYKTTSPIFKKIYSGVAEEVNVIMNWDLVVHTRDIESTEFIVTFSDKTKWKKVFSLPKSRFKACFSVIKQMVPDCEEVPVVLITDEDK